MTQSHIEIQENINNKNQNAVNSTQKTPTQGHYSLAGNTQQNQ